MYDGRFHTDDWMKQIVSDVYTASRTRDVAGESTWPIMDTDYGTKNIIEEVSIFIMIYEWNFPVLLVVTHAPWP